MLKAYKYRIYPNSEQRIQIAKTFGCCRFVYNKTLTYRKEIITWILHIKSSLRNMQDFQNSRTNMITINHIQQIIQMEI